MKILTEIENYYLTNKITSSYKGIIKALHLKLIFDMYLDGVINFKAMYFNYSHI